jgi:ABC-type multidrug transport system ATPase subunit
MEFWEMLKRLKASGITILVSTPYMDEAGMCDRVALIQNGRIMKINKPEEVVAAYTRPLYSVKTGDLYKLIDDLKVMAGIRSAYAFGQVAHMALGKEGRSEEDLRNELASLGHEGIEIKKIRAGIEDCFMELMVP